MAEEAVKLLGMWASPYSRRIEMALKLKGVPYEYLEQDILNKSPMLLQLNPVHKKVPVLIHNGKTLVESQVILEYIDETWRHNPILPHDPYERAMARFWAKFVDEQILVVGAHSFVKAEKGREVAIEDTRQLLKFLEKELIGQEFFGGKNIGFLDIVASTMIPFCLARLWEAYKADVIPEETFPEIHRWIRNLYEIDFVRDCIPPKEKHIEHVKVATNRFKSA